MKNIIFGIALLMVMLFAMNAEDYKSVGRKGYATSARDTSAAYSVYDYGHITMETYLKAESATTFTVDYNVLGYNPSTATWVIVKDLNSLAIGGTASTFFNTTLRTMDTNLIYGPTFKLDRNITITGDSVTIYQYFNLWK